MVVARVPLVGRTGVKVLYEREVDENTYKVCKRCNTAIGRGKIEFPAASQVAAA